MNYRKRANMRRSLYLLLLMMTAMFSLSLSAKAASVDLKVSCKLAASVGKTIKLTAQVDGLEASQVRYKFQYKTGHGSYITLRKYKTGANTAKFTLEENAVYTFRVIARAGSKTYKDTVRVKAASYTAFAKSARKNLLSIAKSYLYTREYSAKHNQLVSYYNNVYNNLYRNNTYMHYTASLSDAWCDIFVSACFIKAGYTAASGVECGCENHIILLQRMGCWVEDDDYIPAAGDLIFYDWHDSGYGDCTGYADHIGIVAKVGANGAMKIIEGNYGDTVKYRTIKNNARYIRGFAVPAYDRIAS